MDKTDQVALVRQSLKFQAMCPQAAISIELASQG